MSNVIEGSFGKKSEPMLRKQSLTGSAVCSACAHEWAAVADLGHNTPMECPQCHAMKGVFKHFIVYSKHLRWACHVCDGYLLTAILIENTPTIACATCGELRNALDLFPS